MATYQEIRSLFSEDDLRHRTTSAVVIAAEEELSVTPGSVGGRAWGLKVLRDPAGWGRIAFLSILASNKASTVVAIQAASDITIQNKVDSARVGWIAAEAGV